MEVNHHSDGEAAQPVKLRDAFREIRRGESRFHGFIRPYRTFWTNSNGLTVRYDSLQTKLVADALFDQFIGSRTHVTWRDVAYIWVVTIEGCGPGSSPTVRKSTPSKADRMSRPQWLSKSRPSRSGLNLRQE